MLYLLRGAPVVHYGDEVGMAGSGGDKAARQDMFPTQVSDWQTETRVGWPPIGKGSWFDVAGNPLGLQLKALAAVRDAHPELSTGASVVRLATGAVLVISRTRPRDRPRGGDGLQQRHHAGDRDGADREPERNLEHRVRQRVL